MANLLMVTYLLGAGVALKQEDAARQKGKHSRGVVRYLLQPGK